jgi:hypothetical protein
VYCALILINLGIKDQKVIHSSMSARKRNFRKREESSSDDEGENAPDISLALAQKKARGIDASRLTKKVQQEQTHEERKYGLVEKRDFKKNLVRQGVIPTATALKEADVEK